MPMPNSKNSKTHANHHDALRANGGHNPNGVHGAHLNLDQIRKDAAAANAAFEAGEYALLDLNEIALADGTELFIVHRKKM